jgi:hypothetical protein
VRALKKFVVRVVCSGLLSSGFALVMPTAAQEVADSMVNAKVDDLPDSPGTSLSRAEASPAHALNNPWLLAQSSSQSSSSQSSSSQSPSPQTQPADTSSAQTSPSKDQNQVPQSQQPPARKQEPVGTAAAEAPRTTGVAASQPAGLAIAPAKQRRVRTIIIRTGAIIGAGVAVGSVIALTEATSSKPPGAH